MSMSLPRYFVQEITLTVRLTFGTDGPWHSNSLTMSTLPVQAARWSGEEPFASRMLVDASCASSNWTTSLWVTAILLEKLPFGSDSIIRHQKVHCRGHNSHTNWVHNLPNFYFSTHINSIVISKPILSLKTPEQNVTRTSVLSQRLLRHPVYP